LAKGDCNVFVKDENNIERFVRSLKPGSYFGEFALITKQRRSATVYAKNYSVCGAISSESFKEMCFLYPDVSVKLKANLKKYKDKYKIWLKKQVKHISYF